MSKTRKINHGIKISYRGFSVTDLDQDRTQQTENEVVLAHLLSGLALPYLIGAKTQLARYKLSASLLKTKPTIATMKCLHEISTLFEDLCTVAIYIRKCNKDHQHHELWRDIRNHIRHAAREELDKENDSVKNKRAQNLGLDPKLQISIGFDIDAIKVGETIVKLAQIKEYLSWAEGVITDILVRAKKDGLVEGIKVSEKS